MNRLTFIVLLACASAVSASLAAQPSTSEKKVWALEDSYWVYVKTNNLEQYRTLWRSDFLGWPLANPEPVRKEHIADWITAHTSAGESLKTYEVERLAAQAAGDYVTVTYRVRLTWVTREGLEKPGRLRVIHTWLRSPADGWQILSGMAAAPDAQGHSGYRSDWAAARRPRL